MSTAPDSTDGHGKRLPDGTITCCACGGDCEWEECHAACEDGFFDAYDGDPLWYDPGDLVACSACGGEGGHWWCGSSQCSTGMITVILTPEIPS